MRLIAVDKIKHGDIIGKDILNSKGSMLLCKQSKFKEAYRSKLKEIGIEEIYIEDEISKGIEPRELISSSIRGALKKDIKHQFRNVKKNMIMDCESISKVVDTLFEHILREEVFCEIIELKANHADTYEHSIGVAIMAMLTCRKLGIEEAYIKKIAVGAILHDIGKVILPKDILNKPGKLTEEEYEIIKTHPSIGYNIVKEEVSLSPLTKVIVLCHHEREDGEGYPLGKKTEIHIGVKIVAACDVFHALLSDRIYRKGLPINSAIRIARTEKLNLEVCEAVESILAFYPVGTIVRLSTGDIAIVEKNFTNNLQQPEVRVINDSTIQGGFQWRIDLQKEKNIFIVSKLEDIPYMDL